MHTQTHGHTYKALRTSVCYHSTEYKNDRRSKTPEQFLIQIYTSPTSRKKEEGVTFHPIVRNYLIIPKRNLRKIKMERNSIDYITKQIIYFESYS